MAGASGSFLLVGAAAAAIWLLPPLFARISSRQLDNRTSLPLVRVSLALLFLVMRSEEHTSELQSLMRTSYAVFCLKKKNLHYIQLVLEESHYVLIYHTQ